MGEFQVELLLNLTPYPCSLPYKLRPIVLQLRLPVSERLARGARGDTQARCHTLSPSSPSCFHVQRPTSLPLRHVITLISFNYFLPNIQLRSPLRHRLGQVCQTHWTRSP